MSTASKRKWRAENPERRRQAEANRAAFRRRHGKSVEWVLGTPPVVFSYPSGDSYQRYERGGYDVARGGSIGRSKQRWNYYLNVVLPARRDANRLKMAILIDEMNEPTDNPALDAVMRDLAAGFRQDLDDILAKPTRVDRA